MISDEQAQAYKRDGVIVVPEVLDQETLGKVRTVLKVPKDTDAEALEARARAEQGIAQLLDQGKVVKVVAVPNRILNFVVKPG